MAREVLDATGNDVYATHIHRINTMTRELAIKWPAAAAARVHCDWTGSENWGVTAGKLNAMFKAFYAASGIGSPTSYRMLDGTGNHDNGRTIKRMNAMFQELYAV